MVLSPGVEKVTAREREMVLCMDRVGGRDSRASCCDEGGRFRKDAEDTKLHIVLETWCWCLD